MRDLEEAQDFLGGCRRRVCECAIVSRGDCRRLQRVCGEKKLGLGKKKHIVGPTTLVCRVPVSSIRSFLPGEQQWGEQLRSGQQPREGCGWGCAKRWGRGAKHNCWYEYERKRRAMCAENSSQLCGTHLKTQQYG